MNSNVKKLGFEKVLCSRELPTIFQGPVVPYLCSSVFVLQGKKRAISLQFLLSQLCQFSGFPSLQLLLEEEQVNVDNAVQHSTGTEESTMQSTSYPIAEHILAWKTQPHMHTSV